jgi:hypothetical protein
MKNFARLRRWQRAKFWIGLLVLLAVGCGEIWMVRGFSRDCARSVMRQEFGIGLSLPEVPFASR